jgi:hypothetical protein
MYKLLAATHNVQLAAALDKEMERFRKWSGTKKLPD